MLTLTRRKGERLNVGLSVEITVLEISGGRVRLGISAPRRLPVHRGEVVERMEVANRAALSRRSANDVGQEHSVLHFPEGLIGLPDHRELVLCESSDNSGLFVLISKADPAMQLSVVEAKLVVPDYPVRDARCAADFEHEDAAVALVVTPGNGEQPTSVNLQAPIVMGLQSHHARQVILLREDLPLRHTLALPVAKAAGAK